MKLSEKYPEPHQKYVVLRDGVLFTATPCYGLHNPWWVVRIMGDKYEAEPEPMIESDEWYPLAESVSAQQDVQRTLPERCDCGRELHIKKLCPVCDNDE